MIQATTALKKISSLKKRIWIIQGGQGAGKTFSILIILISFALKNKEKEVIILSAELTKMRLTVIKDFIKVLKLMNAYNQNNFLGGTLYKFNNGSFIKFIGLDKADVGKGLRSDVAFFNEANKCEFDAYSEIASRSKKVIIDYNPNFQFWADTDIDKKDCDKLILTYKDNELLSEHEKYEIEQYKQKGYINPNLEIYDTDANTLNRYWRNKWKVYGLGIMGITEGVIFENWTSGKFDESLPYCYGLDLGYHPDPSALTKVAVDKKSKKIYVKECFYETRLSFDALYDKIKEHNTNIVVSDTNEPRVINEYITRGIHIKLTEKYSGSVLDSIKRMQDYEIIVGDNSPNVIMELQNYVWNDKKSGTPIGEYDHILSSCRYAFMFLTRDSFTFI